MFGDAALGVVAFVHVKAVAEGDGLSGGQGIVAGAFWFLFKIVNAEGIGGEKAVIAHMPPGWMAQVVRMVKNGDADGLAVNWTGIVAPIGAFSPGLLVAQAGGEDDVAVAGQSFMSQTHGLRDAYGNGAILFVAEDGGLIGRRLQGDIKNEQALVVGAIKDAESADTGEDDGA